MSGKPRTASRTSDRDALAPACRSIIAAAGVAVLLAVAPPPAAAEAESEEVKALQQEVEALRAQVGLLEEHVTKLEEHVGAAPMPAAVEGDRGPATATEQRAGHPLGRSERRLFGPL